MNKPKRRRSPNEIARLHWQWHYTRAFNEMTGFHWSPRLLKEAGRSYVDTKMRSAWRRECNRKRMGLPQ